MGPNNKFLSADERIVCPLCASGETRFLFGSQRKNLIRDYCCCGICDLVFVPSVFHLSFLDQRNRYLEHNNEFDDPLISVDIDKKEYELFLKSLKK